MLSSLASGQYHFVAMIAWKRSVPLLSWITVRINVAGWIALVASGGLLGNQLILGIIAFMNPVYALSGTQQGYGVLMAFAELRIGAMASVLDIHLLQRRRLPHQCVWNFYPSIRHQSSFHLVHFGIRHHIYNVACVLLAKL